MSVHRITKHHTSLNVSEFRGDFKGIFVHMHTKGNQQAVALTIEEANNLYNSLGDMLDILDPE